MRTGVSALRSDMKNFNIADWIRPHRTNAESLKEITTGGSFNCGITTNDTLYCWGSDFYSLSTYYPSGTFTQVIASGVMGNPPKNRPSTNKATHKSYIVLRSERPK